MQDDDTRTRILSAAGEAFAELGFQQATIREICRRAGANLASVNYHFGDKDRLYVETIKYAHQLPSGIVSAPEWGADTPAEVKLRDFIRSMFLRMLAVKGVPWHERLMLREMLEPRGVCQELVEDYIRPHFEQLLGILDELVPPSTPRHRRYQLGFSIVGQCLFYRFDKGVVPTLVPEEELAAHFGPMELADHIADFALAALGRNDLRQAIGEEDVTRPSSLVSSKEPS